MQRFTLEEIRLFKMISIVFIAIVALHSTEANYPLTPVDLRGLWCISYKNSSSEDYAQQLGQAFFYNNGTFTLNFLNNIEYTWVETPRISQLNETITVCYR